MSLTFGSLFAGIGGFDLGLERAGLTCKWQVEIDDYANRVLEKHWPNVRRHKDVRTFPPRSYEFGYSWRGVPQGPFTPDVKRDTTADEWCVDLICGGFPCQDISNAGKRAGIDGERSGLWSEFARIIRVLRPRYVLVENVAALLARGIGRVLGDLAEIGYDAEWECIPAADVCAPHERDRLFLIAFPGGFAREFSILPDGRDDFPHNQKWSSTKNLQSGRGWKRWLNEACHALDGPVSARDFCRVDDGISEELDRFKGIGNAVVPQVAEWIGKRLMETAAA